MIRPHVSVLPPSPEQFDGAKEFGSRGGQRATEGKEEQVVRDDGLMRPRKSTRTSTKSAYANTTYLKDTQLGKRARVYSF